MKEMHIWEIPYKISVKLNNSFLKLVLSKVKRSGKRKLYDKINPCISYRAFRNLLNNPKSLDLDLMISLCKEVGIDKRMLEKNVVAYKTKQSRIWVHKPCLPILPSPLLDMLIAHLMGDGCIIKFKNKKTVYSTYRQYDIELLLSFIKKVEGVFGTLVFPKEYFEDKKRVYLPEALSLILLKHYKLSTDDFLSEKCRIPKKIFRDRLSLIAVLTAFIIDEGSIDSGQVYFNLKNEGLVDDLIKISRGLGYKTSNKRHNTSSGMWCFYILADGLKRYYLDYKTLKKLYPYITLGYKEKFLNAFIKRKRKNWRGLGEGITKNSIIKLLKNSPKTIKELALLLGISRQGIRFHTVSLEKAGIIKNRGVGKFGSSVYMLKKKTIYPTCEKGRSKREGRTREDILKLLNSKPMTAKEISRRLKIYRGDVLIQLYKLKKMKLVEQWDRKHSDSRHSFVWSITKTDGATINL